MMEERIVSVGLRDMDGAERLRVRYFEDRVIFTLVDKDLEFSFARAVWQEHVLETGVAVWGRLLHSAALPGSRPNVVGVTKPLEGVADAEDGCENCGRGFGCDGDLMHLEQGVGVCMVAKIPIRFRS